MALQTIIAPAPPAPSGNGYSLLPASASVKSNVLAGTSVAALSANVPNSAGSLFALTNLDTINSPATSTDGTAQGRFGVSGSELITAIEPLNVEDGATQTVIVQGVSGDAARATAVRQAIPVSVVALLASDLSAAGVTPNQLTLSNTGGVIANAPKGHVWSTVNTGRFLGNGVYSRGRMSIVADPIGTPYTGGKLLYEDCYGLNPARPDAIRQADNVGLGPNQSLTFYLQESIGGYVTISGPFTFTGQPAAQALTNPGVTMITPTFSGYAPLGCKGSFAQLTCTNPNAADVIGWKKVRSPTSTEYLDCDGSGRLHPIKVIPPGTNIQETFLGTSRTGLTVTYTTNLTAGAWDGRCLGAGAIGGFDATQAAMAQTGAASMSGHQGVTWTLTGSPNIDSNGIEFTGSQSMTTTDSRLVGQFGYGGPNMDFAIAFQADSLSSIGNIIQSSAGTTIFGVGPSGCYSGTGAISGTASSITTGTVHIIRGFWFGGSTLWLYLDNGGQQDNDAAAAGPHRTKLYSQGFTAGYFPAGKGIVLGSGFKGKILAAEFFPSAVRIQSPRMRTFIRAMAGEFSSTIATQALPVVLDRTARQTIMRETFDHPDFTNTSPYLQGNGGPWIKGCYTFQSRGTGGDQQYVQSWLQNGYQGFPQPTLPYSQSGSRFQLRCQRMTFAGDLQAGTNDLGGNATVEAPSYYVTTGAGLTTQGACNSNPVGAYTFGALVQYEWTSNTDAYSGGHYFDWWTFCESTEQEFDTSEPQPSLSSTFRPCVVITSHQSGGGNSTAQTAYCYETADTTPQTGDLVYLHCEQDGSNTYYYHDFEQVCVLPLNSGQNWLTNQFDLLFTWGIKLLTQYGQVPNAPRECSIDMVETLFAVNTLSTSDVPSAVTQVGFVYDSTSLTINSFNAEPNGAPITGGTLSVKLGSSAATTYTVTNAQLPYQITGLTPGTAVVLSAAATNGAGTGAFSQAARFTLPATTAPSTTGQTSLSSYTAVVGQTVTANAPTFKGYPTPTVAYQWIWADTGAAISGATSASYTYQSSDLGHTVACRATASNTAGSAPSTSPATSAVQNGGGQADFSNPNNSDLIV